MTESNTDPAPYWRYYWIATLADGKEIPQFDFNGKKTEWKDLPSLPVKIALHPFSKDLASKVKAAGVQALALPLPPVEMEDLNLFRPGDDEVLDLILTEVDTLSEASREVLTRLRDLARRGGILSGRDERFYTQPTVKCLSCGHEWGFNPHARAECPSCKAHDDWFCAYCQENKEPLVIDNQCICPTCKSKGRTRGLKRIMKFKVFAGSPRYDFQPWIRSGGIEVRAAQGKIVIRKQQ
jgi:Zn finger protein HypA/HybF involved in hydrogenase expression